MTGRLRVWSRAIKRFWNSASVAAHATLRRISQYVDAIDVFHVWTTFGCHRMSNLSTDCARSLTLLRNSTIEGPMAPEADKTNWVKIVLFPGSLSTFWMTP